MWLCSSSMSMRFSSLKVRCVGISLQVAWNHLRQLIRSSNVFIFFFFWCFSLYNTWVYATLKFKLFFHNQLTVVSFVCTLPYYNYIFWKCYLSVQIRTIMVENIEKILERGNRCELLVDKTATMQDSAFHFRKQSKRLRRALWMKNAKLL